MKSHQAGGETGWRPSSGKKGTGPELLDAHCNQSVFQRLPGWKDVGRGKEQALRAGGGSWGAQLLILF